MSCLGWASRRISSGEAERTPSRGSERAFVLAFDAEAQIEGNRFLFRNSMLKLIDSPNLEYRCLTAKDETRPKAHCAKGLLREWLTGKTIARLLAAVLSTREFPISSQKYGHCRPPNLASPSCMPLHLQIPRFLFLLVHRIRLLTLQEQCPRQFEPRPLGRMGDLDHRTGLASGKRF